MHTFASLSILAAAAVVAAAPAPAKTPKVISVPLTLINKAESTQDLLANGARRLAKFNNRVSNLKPRQSSGAVTNEDVSYVAEVTIGGTGYSLIVDTGSSNTWCGAQNSCEPSSTGQSTGNSVSVDYGSGSFSGTEYTDNVSFGGETVNGQSIGAASQSSGFSGVDGIIGFGPVDLTEGTVSNTNEVPTFMDNLYSQGSIPTEVLGVSFRPEPGSSTDSTNGELTLGGTDPSKYSGSISYHPKLTSGDASAYWGIAVNKFAYGSSSLGSGNGIVDTGTTLIYLPTSVYNAFLKASGGTTGSASGLPTYSKAPTQDFYFTFGSTTLSLTPSQYLVPQDQYSEFGLASGKYYAWFANGGSSGVNLIIGQKFLENYYAVFDTTNQRIGFATGV